MSDPADHRATVGDIEELALGFHHPVDELVAALDEGDARATGLHGAYTAAALTQLTSQRPDRLTVIVTPTLRDARRLRDDLVAFGAATEGAEIVVLPPPDVSPYGEVSPDRRLVMERLSTQFRLAMGDGVRVLLCPVDGLMRRVTPWAAIEGASAILAVGDSLDIDALRGTLARGGYNAVRLVEDPGTFAIRGGLIDIFSPYSEHPVRLDLFGDDIESIRAFDAQTQRTLEDLQELYVFPAREEILSQESLHRARVQLRELGDSLQLPSSHISELLENLEGGVNFFGVEALLPGLFDLESPCDWIPDDALWVWHDRASLIERAETVWKHLQADYTALLEDGELAFPPDRFFTAPDALFTALRENTRNLDLMPAGATETGFLFKAHDNADVERVRKQHDETEGAVHALLTLVHRFRKSYGRIAFSCQTLGLSERLSGLLRAYGQKTELCEGPIPLSGAAPPAQHIEIYTQSCSSGFRSPVLSLALIPDSAVFGRTVRRPAAKVVEEAFAVSHFRELSPGDLVVHLEFGVARYRGMEKLVLDGVEGDYLALEFHGNDKLYLPVYRLGRVHKHVGAVSSMSLDKLGGTRWSNTKAKVKEELQALAAELLSLYADRASRTGFAYPPPDDYFREFEASFPFEETPHQDAAIQDVLADLQADKPMDRLLCGDVGFGKTEVSIRAAFMVALAGRQVAVLVPTTILAEQHARTFSERLRASPLRVEAISRFRTNKEIKAILADLEAGKVDVLVGTHRLLSDDVEFKDLGLVVIDEEQRFGVRHKEKLKQLRKTVDVLTMTATPIPRTLEMSLLGIRDLSIILTPPTNRLAVRTSVAQFSHAVLREGIERELRRGGQVFVVTNRVVGIAELAETVREVVPQARVVIGHGQMGNSALEKVMQAFIKREADVLVCTTIIESGLDIGSANTIFINRADMFGLAQLYQLRGRVGRGRERAYCYLLVPKRRRLPLDSARRLEVIRTHTDLGSGLYIAQHDLDIRGAGDLLGKDQSGYIRTIGYDLFCELLEEAIQEQRGEDVDDRLEPEVKIPVSAHLPKAYIPDEGLRLLFYKRLSMARSIHELEAVMEELVDRFGRFEPEVRNLREIIAIKIGLAEMGVEKVEAGKKAVVLTLAPTCRLSPDKVVELVSREQGRYILRQDMKLVRWLGPKESEDLLAATRSVVARVAKCMA